MSSDFSPETTGPHEQSKSFNKLIDAISDLSCRAKSNLMEGYERTLLEIAVLLEWSSNKRSKIIADLKKRAAGRTSNSDDKFLNVVEQIGS